MNRESALLRRLCVAWLLLEGVGGATIVRPVSLSSAVSHAARIVHGRVQAVESGRDEAQFPSTWITLDVIDGLKGTSGSRIVFKQPGVAQPLSDGTIARIPGMPTYAVGAEVVLFLHPESAAGFTSPVGLGQGVYWVERGGGGAKVRQGLGAGEPQALGPFLERVRKLGGWSR